MGNVRKPCVAGLFYPADPSTLSKQVSGFLAGAKLRMQDSPKALIVPHAGYRYSGPIAGSAYAQLDLIANEINRVVILAPSHRLPFRGIAYSSAECFSTPLGGIEVDREAVDLVAKLPQTQLLDAAFEGEHSIEVQLPFLQTCLTQFSVVPLLIGSVDQNSVVQVIELLWGNSETLIVISSDLSHYLNYQEACAIDQKTEHAIETLMPENISPHDACGQMAICGLLHTAKQHGLRTTVLDLRNSGDTAGSKDRVVGYGAYAFS